MMTNQKRKIKVHLRYLKIAPRKVRQLADLIRGKDVLEAKDILNFTIKRPALPLLKLLNSAINNAKNKFALTEKDLKIEKIWIDEGPKLKRIFRRARGRADILQKKMSHITLILQEK